MLKQKSKRNPDEPKPGKGAGTEYGSNKEAATGDRRDAPGLADPTIQTSRTPHRGLLADQLYPPDEEPHGVRPKGIGEGDSPPDCHPQTLHAFGCRVDTPQYPALTAVHANCTTT